MGTYNNPTNSIILIGEKLKASTNVMHKAKMDTLAIIN